MKNILRNDIVVDVCPKCLQETVYTANPMYLHTCEHCGEQMRHRDLKRGVYTAEIKNAVSRLLGHYLNENQYVQVKGSRK